MGTFGVELSKANFNIKDTADKNKILTSNFPIFKVFLENEDSLTLPSGDSTVSKTITHNLGYKSIVLVYAVREEGVAKRDLITGKSPFNETFDQVALGVQINANSFTIELNLSGPSFGADRDYAFHYYVLYEDMLV